MVKCIDLIKSMPTPGIYRDQELILAIGSQRFRKKTIILHHPPQN
ncbi:hypothetical protein [Coleofasciculus sp. E1-EBD-02]